MVTWENYEELMMMYADGELGHEDEQALLAFVQEHPELKSELEVYRLTRLTYDPNEVFADKSSLIKTVPQKRIIAMPRWSRYGIAAGIALLLFTGMFRYMQGNKNNTVVIVKDTAHQIPALTATQAPDSTSSKPQNNVLNLKPDSGKIQLAVQRNTKKAIPHIAIKAPTRLQEVTREVPIRHDETLIANVPVAKVIELPHTTEIAGIQELKEIPAFTPEQNEEKHKSSFWDKLPIDDLKKKQLENMAGAVADAVSTVKQDESNKNVTVKVEKRKLMISF